MQGESRNSSRSKEEGHQGQGHKEIKDKEFKEGKDTKEFKEGKELKEFKDGKEIKEKDKDIFEGKGSDRFEEIQQFGSNTGAVGIEQRLGALEENVQRLIHYIGGELRPDLGQSALQGGVDAAKTQKDIKDADR